MKKLLLSIIMMLISFSLVMATPLSIIESKYITFDTSMGTSVWQLILRGDNSPDYTLFAPAESITGTKDGSSVQAQNDVQLSVSVENENCQYSLYDTVAKTDIYHYSLVKEASDQAFWLNDDTIRGCEKKDGYIWGWRYAQIATATAFNDVYCLYSSKYATAGEISEGKINFKATFRLKQEGLADVAANINTLAEDPAEIKNVVNFEKDGKIIAIAKWIGGSTFGETCPGQDEYYAVQYQNTWNTGNKDRYDEYKIAQATLTETINRMKAGTQKKDVNLVKSLVDSANTRASASITPYPLTYGSLTATTSGATSTLQLPRDYLIYAPDFQLLLSTNYLKIVYLTGRPEILNAKFSSCAEGSTTNELAVTVKNIGNTRGEFIASAVCDAGITLSATRRSITLDAGDSGTITIPYTLSLEKDATKACKITVTDSYLLANKDEISVTSDCTASKFCTTEGMTECRGTTQYICKDGQMIPTANTACQNLTCDRDKKCESPETFETCGGKTSSENDCATCNYDNSCGATESFYSCPTDCRTPGTTDYTIFYIIGAAVLAVGVYYFTQMKGKGKSKTKRRRK